MNHKLIVHIGMPKTGTTAIQQFLYDNAALLKEKGFYYPDLFSLCDLERKFHHIYIEKNGTIFFDETGNIDFNSERWNKIWQVLKEELSENNVIISAEELSIYKDFYDFIRKSKMMHSEIKVIIYIRRQDIWFESMWGQYVKTSNCSLKLDDFIEQIDFGDLLDYEKFLSETEKIIGSENLIVRLYDRSQFVDNDISMDFLSAIGFHNDGDAKYIHTKVMNESLKGSYLEIKRILNSTDFSAEVTDEWRYIDTFLKLSSMYKKNCCYMSDDLRKNILSKYNESNTQTARKYFNREDGILFYDNISDMPVYSNEISTNEITKAFSSIFLKQESKIQQLEQLLKRAVSNKYDFLIGGRKITLFGAGYICKKFCSINYLPIADIVDNDKSKAGTTVNGCIVKHFDEITDWEDRFVVITCNAYKDISSQLSSIGLKLNCDFIIFADNDC